MWLYTYVCVFQNIVKQFVFLVRKAFNENSVEYLKLNFLE